MTDIIIIALGVILFLYITFIFAVVFFDPD
jgi:hypothetical protein